MSIGAIGLTGLGILFVLLILRMPVAFAMFVVGFILNAILWLYLAWVLLVR